MDVAVLAAAVVLGVQVIKTGLKELGLIVQGWGAVLLAILASAAVVSFEAVHQVIPFNLALFWIFAQVAFFAATGKAFLSYTINKLKAPTLPPVP